MIINKDKLKYTSFYELPVGRLFTIRFTGEVYYKLSVGTYRNIKDKRPTSVGPFRSCLKVYAKVKRTTCFEPS